MSDIPSTAVHPHTRSVSSPLTLLCVSHGCPPRDHGSSRVVPCAYHCSLPTPLSTPISCLVVWPPPLSITRAPLPPTRPSHCSSHPCPHISTTVSLCRSLRRTLDCDTRAWAYAISHAPPSLPSSCQRAWAYAISHSPPLSPFLLPTHRYIKRTRFLFSSLPSIVRSDDESWIA